MKDYYKILGVEEEASEEEIRARWIALTKRYHPDLGKTGQKADERIKEVNEAYGVLKDSSKRLDYDFERVLRKKVRSRKEKSVTNRKRILPACVLILFFAVGLIIFERYHVAVPNQSEVFYKTDKELEKKSASQIPPVRTELRAQGDKEVPREIVSIPTPLSHSVKREPERRGEPERRILPKSEVPLGGRNEIPKEMRKEMPDERREIAEKESRRKGELVAHVAARSEPARGERLEEVPKEINQVVPQESRTINQPKPAVAEPPPPPKSEIIAKAEQAGLASFAPPPPFATEDEVKQFFSDYRDRYTRRDVDRFLSLFSARAIQNQKDGLEEIRKIYNNFFDQSRELRYRLEDAKIEVYQNIAEVKARFRVDQIVKKKGGEKVWKGSIRWLLIREEGALKIVSLDYRNEKPEGGKRREAE